MDLAGRIREALGTDFRPAEMSVSVSVPARPDISLGRLYDTHWDLLWFLIPMRVFRPTFDRVFHRNIAGEVEKNLSRLASQWTEAVNEAIGEMTRQAEGHVKEELSTIGRLLMSATSDVPRIAADLERIEALRQRLRLAS
jgi:hypothetical protein